MWHRYSEVPISAPQPGSPPSQGRAQASLPRRNFEAALREYNQAIHAAPELAEAYCRRGVVYHEMGKTEQALTDLDRAIQCDPRLPSAYLERGKMRTESGDFDGALADFGQLMTIRANDPDTYLQPRNLPGEEGARERRRRRFSSGAQTDQPFRLTPNPPRITFARFLTNQAGSRRPSSRPNGSTRLCQHHPSRELRITPFDRPI